MPDFLKDYEPVEDRLRAFWSDHPEGRIETVMVGETDGRFVVQAWAYRTEDGKPASSGLAMERETDRGVNATSALENCETSAIGRALANLGYAAKGKRPSREEMSKTSAAGATSGKGTAADTGGADKGTSLPASTSPQSSGRGEAQDPKTASASPGFPVDPAECSHRFPSGSWLRWTSTDQCPKCGTPKLVAMEGTTEDLGPA